MSTRRVEPALATYQHEFWDEGDENRSLVVLATDTPKRSKSLWLVFGVFMIVAFAAALNWMNRLPTNAKTQAAVVSPPPSNTIIMQDVTCTDGQYLASGKCHTCPAGYACKNNAKTICVAGKFQASTGKSTCTTASCGSFVPAAGAVTQETCRPGTFSGPGSIRCTPNPKGHFSGAGACAATKCPKGEYQDCEGQSKCQPGPCGHFVSGTGSITYHPCPAGTYQPSNGKDMCVDTLPGTYAGIGHCKPRQCTPGFYQDQAKQSSCKPASCGWHVPSLGANNQVACGKGTYQPDKGQSSCLSIPKGYVSINKGCGIECCAAGTYRDANFKCVPAPCGKYVPNKCASNALPCPPGEFTSGPGASACTKAPPGSIPNPNQCGTQKCPVGTYQNLAGGTTCKDTQCGEYAPQTGMSMPSKCAPGSFQDKTKQTSCKPCPVGTSQGAQGKCSCPQCSAGSYQDKAGKTSCIPAPCGSFVGGQGASKADPCPPGQYQDKTGQSGCIQAPPGKYAVGGKCSPGTCPPGTFTNAAGMTKCTDAPCGTYVGVAGATSATSCAAGMYQPLGGQTKCLKSPTGSYTDGTGKCKEILCKAGQYQSQTGQQNCLPSKCGHYVPTIGSATQYPCGPGRYSPNTGATVCLQADVGHYVSGHTACKQDRCPSGTFTDCKGQSKCTPAWCGSYVSGTGKSGVTKCPAGTYQDTPGQGSCKTAPAGSFSKLGYCHTQQCDPGTYQNVVGQSTCKPANCGNFVEGEGRTSETQCPSGSYQPKTGQVGCLRTSHGNAPNPGTCEKGTVAGGMYYPGPSQMKWQDALNWCRGNGDELAMIKSAAENGAVVNTCRDGGKVCWVGGTDQAKEGTWKWVDGSPLAGNYQNWAPGEPNNHQVENCLATWTNGKWNDVSCARAFFFVCERRPTKKPTATPTKTPTKSPTKPAAKIKIDPAKMTIFNPPAVIAGGELKPVDYASVKSALDTYGCSKLNIYFWAVHHWSYSTAKTCTVSGNSIRFVAPGSPSGTVRGGWDLSFTLHSDNKISSCVYLKNRPARGCHLDGHGSGWFQISFSITQPSWYTQLRPVSPQQNTHYLQALTTLGECPHFEITETTGAKVKFIQSSCWWSNLDWLSIVGINTGKNLVVSVGLTAPNAWHKNMNLYNCHYQNYVGGITTSIQVALNVKFPVLNAKCSVADIKILV